jgi:hypothetical protein
MQSPPRGLNPLVREAKSAVLGFPQVEHLFKTGGLRNTSTDFNRVWCLNEANILNPNSRYLNSLRSQGLDRSPETRSILKSVFETDSREAGRARSKDYKRLIAGEKIQMSEHFCI